MHPIHRQARIHHESLATSVKTRFAWEKHGPWDL